MADGDRVKRMGIAVNIGIAFCRSQFYYNDQVQLFCANKDGIVRAWKRRSHNLRIKKRG
jgi:hypothetical protein